MGQKKPSRHVSKPGGGWSHLAQVLLGILKWGIQWITKMGWGALGKFHTLPPGDPMIPDMAHRAEFMHARALELCNSGRAMRGSVFGADVGCNLPSVRVDPNYPGFILHVTNEALAFDPVRNLEMDMCADPNVIQKGSIFGRDVGCVLPALYAGQPIEGMSLHGYEDMILVCQDGATLDSIKTPTPNLYI